MGQHADIQNLVGKRISYHDGFTGSTAAFTITEVTQQQERVEIRGKKQQDFLYFTSTAARILAARKSLTNAYKIDGCNCHDTYTIQG